MRGKRCLKELSLLTVLTNGRIMNLKFKTGKISIQDHPGVSLSKHENKRVICKLKIIQKSTM